MALSFTLAAAEGKCESGKCESGKCNSSEKTETKCKCVEGASSKKESKEAPDKGKCGQGKCG